MSISYKNRKKKIKYSQYDFTKQQERFIKQGKLDPSEEQTVVLDYGQ